MTSTVACLPGVNDHVTPVECPEAQLLYQGNNISFEVSLSEEELPGAQ